MLLKGGVATPSTPPLDPPLQDHGSKVDETIAFSQDHANQSINSHTL